MASAYVFGNKETTEIGIIITNIGSYAIKHEYSEFCRNLRGVRHKNADTFRQLAFVLRATQVS